MTKLNRKKYIISALVGMGLMSSLSANAQDNAVESALTNMIIAQGQQVIQDMSAQLQHSITQEINNFTIDGTLSWLAIDAQSRKHQVNVEITKLNNKAIKTSADE